MADNPNGFPTYSCGAFPAVGDLVEFGSQNHRYVITSMQDTSGPYLLFSGARQFDEGGLRFMRLVARFGGDR